MATVKIFRHHMHVVFLLLLIVEFVDLFFCSYAGFYLRFGHIAWRPETPGFESLPIQATATAFIFLLGMIAMGQYQAQRPSTRFVLASIVFRLSISLFLGILAIMIAYYLFPSLYMGRGVLVYTLLTALLSLSLIRLIFYGSVDSNILRRRVLIYGAGEPAAGLLDMNEVGKYRLSPTNGSYVIRGFVPVEGEDTFVPREYCVNPDEGLLAYCKSNDVDEIVVAIKDRRSKLPVNALLDCKLSNIGVIDFISFHEREKGILHLDILQPSWMIFSDGYGVGGNIRAITERCFDILFSVIILSLTAPIIALTALAILIESGGRGPIFYRQKRVGLNNAVFELIKFRSMTVDAEKDGKAIWAKQNDKRVTKVGRFIRKTRIDEIPQLFNVLCGEMSIVGPRPERPEFVERLEKNIPYYRLRHRVRPGLAGWAQIKYPYGADEKDAYNKLQFDLFYIKNRTFIMDLLVLLQTIEVVILGKGAR